MARGHLFVIVVLLAAAAVAGLLAVAQTAQTSPTSAADPAITFRMQTKLNRLEASLQRQLARQRTAKQSEPAVVYTRAPAPTVSATHDDGEHEASGDHESGRDD
jgi:hypothetical protein